MKRCTECHQLFEPTSDNFYADKRAKDGLYGCCKPCFLKRGKRSRDKDVVRTRAMALERYYRHRETHLASGRKYRAKNKDKEANRHHNYYLRNKAHVQNYQKQTLDVCRQRTAAWKQRNLERAKLLARIRAHNRRVKIRRTDDCYGPEDVKKQIAAQNNKCWWCGKPLDDEFHVDHRVPVSKGGSNAAGNIVIAHPKCNLSKSDKMPWEFNGRLL